MNLLTLQTVGVPLPADVVKVIDQLAGQELISRAAWIRRLVSNEINRANKAKVKA
jgi:metal-responsive CopG/Arc/MetJ family transcriptional regulator